jgi:hypothetical protein
MTNHLSPQQFADAADGGTTPASVQAHLASCAACAARLTEFRAIVSSLADAADVPEPSPLFWDHFSTRVRAAIAAEPATAPAWWPRWWRQVVALGAMAAVATVVVLSRLSNAPDQDLMSPAPSIASSATASGADLGAAGVAATVTASATDDAPWNLIVAMAGTLAHEDLHDVVPPAHGTAGMVDDLTPEQRAAFVQLVKQQMGGTE